MSDQINSVIISSAIVLTMFGAWLFGLWYVYKETERRRQQNEIASIRQILWVFLAIFPVVGPLAYFIRQRQAAYSFSSWRPGGGSSADAIYDIHTNIPGGIAASAVEPSTQVWSQTGGDYVIDDNRSGAVERTTEIPDDMPRLSPKLEVGAGPGRIIGDGVLLSGQTIVGATPSEMTRFIVVGGDKAISGQHILVDFDPHAGVMSLTNLSKHSRTEVDGRLLARNEKAAITPGLTIKLGYTTFNLAGGERQLSPTTRQTEPPVYSDEYNALFNESPPATMSPYCLRIIKGANYGHVHPVAGAAILLGRDQHQCHICLNGDPTISKIHAEIFQRGSDLHIENRSQYGTLVNNNSIVIKRLGVGDEIQLGETVLRVEAGQ